LLEQFRQMLNDCIRIGLAENVTSLKALSLKAYNQLSRHDVASYYKLCAISAATGILRNYRKAKRKNPYVNEPYARRPRLTTCYGFKIRDGELSLPIHAKEHIPISLNQHVQATIGGFRLRSVTLTADRLSLAYANEVQQLQPRGFIGIDRNLDNVTVAATDGPVQQHDLSEATQAKVVYRDVRSHFKRSDVRIRREVSGKYGQKQREKVQQILHHASKLIVEEAKAKQCGIAMEKLTGIRKLYRRGNWQGRWYRGCMNSWSYGELQRQIEYKARWEGLPGSGNLDRGSIRLILAGNLRGGFGTLDTVKKRDRDELQTCTYLTVKRFPYQIEFKDIKETWGKVRLEDGATINTRYILSELLAESEDVFGPHVFVGGVVALRVECPNEILDKVKDKPIAELGQAVPLTVTAGYETVSIAEVLIPTKSVYVFEEKQLTVELRIDAAARNMSYKTMSGAPLYNIRWTVKQKIEKAQKSP